MTKKEQRNLNAAIRLAIRTDNLPFTFEDEHKRK